MKVFSGPGIDAGHLDTLHRFLTERGWELDEDSDRAGTGAPVSLDATWFYADSFGGVTMNDLGDLTPYRLNCHFSYDEGDLGVVVGSAGNYQGCADHDEREHRIDVDGDTLDLDALAGLLDDLESQAGALNPRDLIECRFFGPCGDDADD